MNPEKQRIAIAEACGVKPTPEGWMVKHKTEDRIILSDWHKATCDLWLDQHPDFKNSWEVAQSYRYPDYLNDLNAMHDAEKTLPSLDDNGFDQGTYCEMLERVLGARFESRNSYDEWMLTTATAAQRAEAFLKTIGKWEEE